ncbi:MAG TPA: type II secretion system F family protein, partial [Methanocorpusculum sp.]|nr:type II secretion system F family protein [Methanocorpusculum sp.]
MTSIPPSLKDRKKMRLAVLDAEIFSARMQVKAEKLYLYALISGWLFGTVLYLFLLYLSLRMVPSSLSLNAPEFCVILGVTLLVPAFAAAYVVFAGVLYLPKVLCKRRGTRIDLSLFHAVTYLYALHQSEPNLYAVVESLAKYADSYGEAAREFRQVISDCRICSLDFYSALGRLSQTTPSEKFRSFLTGLSSSYRTLGSATEYLRMKTDELREEQRLSQKMYLNTLGVIAEIYITVFVAGPLFLVIVVMVMGVISSVNPLVLVLIIYVMLPFGTALFLLILSVISDTHAETTTEI